MNELLLDVIEQKHTIRILLALYQNKQSFCSMVNKLGINTATLEKRLKLLESHRLVLRTPCSEDARCVGYSLSKKGSQIAYQLKDILK